MESSSGENKSGSPQPGARAAGGEPRWLVPCICAALAAITWVVFGQTARFEFINYDDDDIIYDNRAVVQGITWKGLGWAFAHSQGGNYAPLTTISHMLDCQLFGLRAGGHHFVNVLLHAAVAVLLFLALKRMTRALWPAAFAAALFAVHPLRVESVAWVTERKDVLSGLFFMLTLLAYERYARQPWSLARYIAVFVLFACGLLSKSMLVTVPFVLLLLDWWPLQRMPGVRLSRLIMEKLPLLALSIAASVVQMRVARASGSFELGDTLPLTQRAGNAMVSYADYIEKLFYPVQLAVLYPHPGEGIQMSAVALSLLVLLGITAGVFPFRRTMPWLAIGWLWYLGMLVPVIGIVQTGEYAMADRYTYLPQIGLVISLVWSADWLGRRGSVAGIPSRPAILGTSALGVLAVAVLTVLAWRQASLWRDGETLWRHTLECTTQNATAHHQLGNLLKKDSRRLDEAAAHFRQALEINPDNAGSLTNLGNVHKAQGRLDDAITLYRKALAIEPDKAYPHSNLAVALADRGEVKEAAALYERALAIDPDLPEELNNLAWLRATCARAELRDGAEAVRLARRAIELSVGESPALLDTLAVALAEAGRFPEAIATAERALQLARDSRQEQVADEIAQHLQCFRASRPYHEK